MYFLSKNGDVIASLCDRETQRVRVPPKRGKNGTLETSINPGPGSFERAAPL